ncbi:MAG TPA: type II toxin-antitoxin system PemK/MazF family toxin [Dehalococcoidales bacterium]|nr:type II toxin-antitoxin system PemK/MazF family toxin [Dehalococcoidales bacterium]
MGRGYSAEMAAMMDNYKPKPDTKRLFPRFGDIYEVNLDPVVGAETGKYRPALVVSNNINNEFSQTVTVLPITSQPAEKLYPFEVPVPKGTAGLNSDSRIKANQVRTLDKSRLVSFKGSLPAEYLPGVEKALRIHLNMT